MKIKKKYLIKYTIEFFVIVLGITISFWINEWNRDRINFSSHKTDLIGLINDLKNDSIKFKPILIELNKGAIATKKIVEVSEAYNLKKSNYDELTKQLVEIGFPYGYQTFFMTDATYKSLILENKISNFPQEIQNKISNYYEFIAKRVIDNNHIVDQICLNYYNNIHPFAMYHNNDNNFEDNIQPKGGFDDDNVAFKNYFKISSIKKKYTDINFFIGSSNLLNRIGVYKRQISKFSNERDILSETLYNYLKRITL